MTAHQATLVLSKQTAIVAVLVWLCSSKLGAAEDRFWVPAKINGKSVKLIFDTGAEATFLFRETAERFGLRVTNAPATIKPGPGTAFGTTETCDLTIADRTAKAAVAVVDKPRGVLTTVEGVVGWPAFRENIIQFNATTLQLGVGTLTSVPKETTNWIKFALRTNVNFLVIEVPEGTGESVAVSIDTGSRAGMRLNPEGWHEWINRHPERVRTLEAYLMTGAGLVVEEVTWADKVTLGNLTLTEIPISEANATMIAMGSPRFSATLGLAALRRMDLMVDGRSGVAYVRPLKMPPIPFNHNRIGAIFVPADVARDEELIAHVLDGSPASEVGILNGDILQKIDSLDVTTWRSNPAVQPLSRFFEKPPGTKITLTLKRDEKIYQADVVLRDLIGPKSVASP